MVVALALAGCGGPALRIEGPAPSPGPDPLSANGLRPDQLANIHNVDLRRTLLADPGVSESVKRTLEACGACGLANPVYADVTGDEQDDVLVPVDSGGSGGLMAAYAYAVRDGRLRQVFHYEGLDFGVRVRDGAVQVIQAVYGPDDPHCCPSSHDVQTYSWDGSRLVRR
ncbi:hypothetical protein [Saccharopolyspora rosea]|uniref:hypothetical protein n=1 Tax=Saccharopolyspora rosea TaxID=524884 RepID=UPI0021D94920|nr:hypothetical protein [Saccharopolyspora rosea]